MTEAQKRLAALKSRQSKERGRMAELGLAAELTTETRAELDTIESGTPDLERQIRAATVAVETEDAEAKAKGEERDVGPDAETRERVELRSKASLTNYVLAALRGRMVSGAEAELQAAAGVGGIPLELWDVPQRERRSQSDDPEQRVVAAAPGTVGVNLDPIRPAVFANSIASRLGIDMPRVESGTYATGTITTSQTAAAAAKSAAAAGVAGAITVQTATPKRVSARLELTLEDISAAGQANFEAILRENLAMALSHQLDDQVINGDGVAPNLAGIITRLRNINNPTDPTTRTFDDYVAAFSLSIDGLWAATAKEVGIVAGPATYRQSAATFRDPATGTAGGRGAEAFADYAASKYGGWWTNSRMPAPVSDVQVGVVYRMGRSMMGGSGAMRTAVCPHWGEASIDDIYSGSASAERYFTMHVLLGDVILVQPAAYTLREFFTG